MGCLFVIIKKKGKVFYFTLFFTLFADYFTPRYAILCGVNHKITKTQNAGNRRNRGL